MLQNNDKTNVHRFNFITQIFITKLYNLKAT